MWGYFCESVGLHTPRSSGMHRVLSECGCVWTHDLWWGVSAHLFISAELKSHLLLAYALRETIHWSRRGRKPEYPVKTPEDAIRSYQLTCSAEPVDQFWPVEHQLTHSVTGRECPRCYLMVGWCTNCRRTSTFVIQGFCDCLLSGDNLVISL